jgi:hypothetical protein
MGHISRRSDGMACGGFRCERASSHVGCCDDAAVRGRRRTQQRQGLRDVPGATVLITGEGGTGRRASWITPRRRLTTWGRPPCAPEPRTSMRAVRSGRLRQRLGSLREPTRNGSWRRRCGIGPGPQAPVADADGPARPRGLRASISEWVPELLHDLDGADAVAMLAVGSRPAVGRRGAVPLLGRLGALPAAACACSREGDGDPRRAAVEEFLAARSSRSPARPPRLRRAVHAA